MKRNVVTFMIVLLGLTAVGAVTSLTARGGSEPPYDQLAATENTPRSTFSLVAAQAFSGWDVYNVGASAGEFPLVAVLRRHDTMSPSPYPANYVSFIYGNCYARADYGCAPPAEIQSWPACSRHRALYTDSPLSPKAEETSIRGVPASFFEDGTRLEVYTGNATVVLFGRSKDATLSLANALRGVNLTVTPTEPLPEPAAGALEGKLQCS